MPTLTEEEPPAVVDERNLASLRELCLKDMAAQEKRPIDPDLKRDLQHGWLLDYLLPIESAAYGRWDYWAECQSKEELPDKPIPRITFHEQLHPGARKSLEKALNSIPRHGSWQSMGGWQYFRYLLDWMLYGFGYAGQKELPEEPSGCEGACMRLYQKLNLWPLLMWPSDYLGQMMAENEYGKKQGFYPTPHGVVELMVQMVMIGGGKDARIETVMDCCLGSGRMLLHASNHSLRLTGMDIDETMCKASLVNGYLFAPWLVKPIWHLDPIMATMAEDLNMGPVRRGDSLRDPITHPDWAPKAETALKAAAKISDNLMELAAPHYLENQFPERSLGGSEHDAEGQAATAPIIKRSSKMKKLEDAGQGGLF